MNGSEMSLGELIAGVCLASWPVFAVIGGTVHYFVARWKHITSGKDPHTFDWTIGEIPWFLLWILWPVAMATVAIGAVVWTAQRKFDQVAQRNFTRRQHPEHEPGQLSEVPGERGQLYIPDKRPPGPGVKWSDLRTQREENADDDA